MDEVDGCSFDMNLSVNFSLAFPGVEFHCIARQDSWGDGD